MGNAAADISGYIQDGKGRLVPIDIVSEIDKTRDGMVRHLVKNALDLQAKMVEYKQQSMNEIDSFVELSAMDYGVVLGGTKGNLTLHSYDMKYKIQVQIQEYFVFDERLKVAKTLIDDCLRDWTQGSRSEIKTIITDAFQVDKEGRINIKRILSLRSLDIKDPKWQKAMDAITDSLQVAGSKRLYRLYRKEASTDKWIPITLEMSAL